MGARLVSMALAAPWAGTLTSTEHLVLIVMCQTALDSMSDTNPRARYFGGVEHLITATAGHLDQGSPEHEAARRRIRRALARLEKVGAVHRLAEAAARRNAVWQVLVDQPFLPVDNVVIEPVDNPPESPGGGTPVSPRTDTSVPLNGHQCPPERTPVSPLKRGTNRGTIKEQGQRMKRTRSGTSPAPSTGQHEGGVVVSLDTARELAGGQASTRSNGDEIPMLIEHTRAAVERDARKHDAQVLADRGTPRSVIAKTLGISAATLSRWLR